MKNMDHYDTATLKLERACSVSHVLSASHQDGEAILSPGDVEIMSSLIRDLIEDARTELSQIEL